MKKYKRFFDFTETREEAERIKADYTKRATPYQRRKHPAYITEFMPKNPETDKARFIVWYTYK